MEFFTHPSPPQPPFVGRELELQHAMRAAHRALVRGKAQLLNLVGDPGVGKSRLASELIERVCSRALPRPAVLRAIAPLPGEPEPFEQLIRQHYAAHATPSGGLGPHVSKVLRELVDNGQLEGGNFLTARFLGFVSTNSPLLSMIADAISPGLEAEVGMLVAVLEHEARQTPLVLVLEDLHFCSQRTIDLVQALGRRLRGRVLMITTSRADVLGDLVSDSDPLVTLHLGPMPEHARPRSRPAGVTDSELEDAWFESYSPSSTSPPSFPPSEQSGVRLRAAARLESAPPRARTR